MFKSRIKLLMMIAAAYAVGLSSAFWLDWQLAVIVASMCFFVVYLGYALASLGYLNKSFLKKLAVTSDAPAFVIFLVTLITVATGLVALFTIVNADNGRSLGWLIVALASVPLGWATIHMMAAFHYAHLFWRFSSGSAHDGGLKFPGEDEPDGWDFVYFAFVIGMTAQTADVDITGANIRRFALMHCIVAFFFNAVLVAAAVNVVVAGR